MRATLFAIFLISLCLFFFCDNRADPDIFGHLKFGQDIFQSRSIPRYDTYSYSSYSSAWTNHEWLSELIFYAIYRTSTSAGLTMLKFLIGLAIALIIYRSVSRASKSVFLRIIFVLAPLSVISYGFATRPQIVTYLFFTCIVYLVDRFESTKKSFYLYPLPLIFLFWSNLHGGFAAGLGIIWLYLLFKVYERKVPGILIFTIAFSTLATFINPYGAGLWIFLAKSVTKARPFIPEWGQVAMTVKYLDYFALAIVSAIGVGFSKRRRHAYEIAALALALFISFNHNRHIPLFAILAAIYVPKYFDSFACGFFSGLESRFSKKVHSVLLIVFIICFIPNSILKNRMDFFLIHINEDRYPVHATAFMRDKGISGNIFAWFDWAQMCLWKIPNSKVFFDGRYETVYSDSLISGYFDVLKGRRDYREYLSRFAKTDIMLLQASSPMAGALSGDKEWTRVYSDPLAVIFMRNEFIGKGSRWHKI